MSASTAFSKDSVGEKADKVPPVPSLSEVAQSHRTFPTTLNRGFSISPTALTPARRGASIRWA